MGSRALILIDTHIWIWWVSDPQKLRRQHAELLSSADQDWALSAISCWEVAKLVEYDRLSLIQPLDEWLKAALSIPRLQLIPLTPEIAIESTRLPGTFHRDPADQIIVATARIHQVPLLTEDSRILAYPHIQLS